MRLPALPLLLALALALAAPAAGSVASPALTVRSTSYGSILFDGRGHALYAFTGDRRGGRSTCYGACAKAWPVYFAPGRLRAGRGVRQSLIGTTRRRDGRRQVTYAGRALYFYVGDGVGGVKCQGVTEFGGDWLVVRPNGSLVR
jgi:predicted lipoprotein with Yx(FWY)xxD motif